MLLHKKNRLIPKRRSRLPWLFLVLLLGLCGLAVVKLNSINSEAHVNSNSDVPEFDFFRPTDESPSQPEELPEPEPPTVEDLIGPFPIDISEAEYDEGSDSLLYLAANGNIARLTINHQLQSHLSRVMARYDEPAQALVALDPATGRVLAWVGDRNSSSPVESPISSAVPWAASVFKIVSGAMLLSETSIDASRNYCVPPSRRSVELEDLTANSSRDSRCVDMTQAMAHSTNAYFARLVDQHISAELLGSWLERFAFNEIIPFELACEVSVAVVPSDRLERARMAAGFRHSRLSPLHGALLAGAVANRGLMMRPTIIQEIHDNTGNLLYRHEPEVWRQVMSERVAQRLADSLTLTATVGTARRYFRNREGWPRDLTVSGKTGTLSNRFDDEHEFDQNLIYTWFVGYSPSDEPNIAVSAVVYNTERWHIRGSFLASEAVIRYQRVRPQPSE